MIPNISYPEIINTISKFSSQKRSESASFLAWYLANYYRLDDLEAIDCICDQPGDKGVDGIYINDGAGTIDIFQSKISQKNNSSIGDTILKEFHGTISQFESKEKLQHLIDNAGDVQVKSLIKRLDLINKINDYEVRGVFISNLNLDSNGISFIENSKKISFSGRNEIEQNYISEQKESLQNGKAYFDIFGISLSDYSVDKHTKASIGPILASDLVKLSGIENQSLFSSNVRASLGNTKVNKDIAKSIKNKDLHKSFPLFHNGITILAKNVSHDENKLTINDYYVVNGCQSLNTLYKNKDQISNDLRILTKFIQVDAKSQLSDLITTNSNNQNGVKARDFKSNHPIQTRLQRDFDKHYPNEYYYEVKRGEPQKNQGIYLSNEEVGLLLISFDLQEPWTTHRKYQVFEDRYTEIYGRPDVTSDKIVLINIIKESLKQKLPNLKNQIIGKYVLTMYDMLLAMRKILSEDSLGREIIKNPKKYIRDKSNREKFIKLIDEMTSLLIIDLDAETQDLSDDFDYRGKLRDKEYVNSLVNGLVASYKKDVLRKKANSISDIWKSFN